MRKIGSVTLLALLLVLGLLFSGRPNTSEQKDAESSAVTISHRMKTNDEASDGTLGKPSKVTQRPEHPETKIPLAEPVADQPGYVIHPVTGKTVDVRGIPAGLMVQESGAMFQIPKMGYVITSEAYNKAVLNNAGGIGWGRGPSVVSCKPIQWETQWDDGTPYVPEEEREKPEQSLE